MGSILDGLHPELLSRILRVLDAMQALGFPMRVVQGVRTNAQQQALFAQGRTAPGKVVTDADGILHRSNHQPGLQDGLGHAVDCAFATGDPFGESQPWAAYGACCEAVGLMWGGGHTHGWHGQDRPHAQLST